MIYAGICIVLLLILIYILNTSNLNKIILAITIFISSLFFINASKIPLEFKGGDASIEDETITDRGRAGSTVSETKLDKLHNNSKKLDKYYFKYNVSLKNFTIDSEIMKLIDLRVQKILNGEPVFISHILSDAKHSDKFSRIIDIDGKHEKYQRREMEFKQVLHWGQLKLMLTEIEFITLAYEQHGNDPRPLYMVYAGAAPGQHTKYLSKLFPTVHFELYDPNDFAIEESEMIKIHVQFYTDVDSNYWKSQSDTKYVIFCSDIRTEPPNEESVIINMTMQLEWWKIMNPELTMFKFRLPWKPGYTDYAKGDIYIQPYPGPTSTETRLIIKKNAPIIKYDHKKYEDACYTHNFQTRTNYYDIIDNTGTILDVNIVDNNLCNCYDCAAFMHIINKYLKLNISDKTSAQLIASIQKQITFGKHNILNQTITSFNKLLIGITTRIVLPCDNNKCQLEYDKLVLMLGSNNKKSRATNDATTLAIEQSKKKKQHLSLN